MIDQISEIGNELAAARKLTEELLQTEYYKGIGPVGVFAIIQKAKSIGMDPMEALNGGLYYIHGHVEMKGHSMLRFIRSAGHSVQIDPSSTDEFARLKGTRADNKDTWTVEFSVKDAKRAGLFRQGGAWDKYPHVMCVWRCVSMLSRFLFSDLLHGCYVEGEIEDCNPDHRINQINIGHLDPEKLKNICEETLTKEQIDVILSKLSFCNDIFKAKLWERIKKIAKKDSITTWQEVPQNLYKRIVDHIELYTKSQKVQNEN